MTDPSDEVHWFKLLNNSKKNQNYIMFAPPPDNNSRDFQTTVWVSSSVDHHDHWDVHTAAPIYASVFELTITSNGIPTLQKTEAKSPTPGGFIVKTGPDFPETDSNGNAYVLGFGKTDGATKKVAPCASRVAKKEQSITVKPVIQLHFFPSDAKSGDFIDFKETIHIGTGHVNFSDHLDATLCYALHRSKDESGAHAEWTMAYTKEPPV
ncbi:hypothetical protein ASPCADRAFT_502662 [Aspergillus carbonarius ITEM 5010]|uniref:Uncharacterized protein n=1 Tax=Aspergillus carbonarius (strain ITEM 5010) TaxID=602072 RepID=A0A1R3S0U5_ASPC5|nr:hypothetical protein ASPCADRAFT_502662 [Aspergillus carbonarius ITEM 5010]